MVTETQGNESQGSEGSGGESSGGETGGGHESTGGEESSSPMPDDPKFAEQGGDTHTAGTPIDGKIIPKPGYSANYKFKVLDQEKEFDEWAKSVIKDADTEKKVRDLYERAHGLDHVKNDRQKLREVNQGYQSEIQRHTQVVNGVNAMLATKDYDNLFKFLNVPEDDVLRQAQKILKLREMPPEQRQAYDQAAQDRQRVMALENQNQYLTQSHEQVAVAARTQELDWTLGRPEISQLVEAYDTRSGSPGAFRQAVIERGKYHALAMGQDITPEQAVNEVLAFLGGPQALRSQGGKPVVQAANGGGSPVIPERKPVITNIQGRGTSPAKKVIKSIDDIKKRARELASEAS